MAVFYNVPQLFNIKKDKAAFRNILVWETNKDSANELPSELTLAKSISSVITHVLIEMEHSKTLEGAVYIGEGYELTFWEDLLRHLIGGEVTVKSALDQIEEMIKKI